MCVARKLQELRKHGVEESTCSSIVFDLHNAALNCSFHDRHVESISSREVMGGMVTVTPLTRYHSTDQDFKVQKRERLELQFEKCACAR